MNVAWGELESGAVKIDLSRISALTFDCYGTLIDWERGILAVLRSWAERVDVKIGDDELLALFAQAEPAAERSSPASAYPEILRDVLRRIGEQLSVEFLNSDAARLAASVGDWPAFPDTVDALVRLKSRCKLIIVSNVDRDSFSRTAKKLGVEFDAVITAQQIGAYKPDRRMFDAAIRAVESLGVSHDGHLHVAQSLYHDIEPAGALGISTCWVDRRGGLAGGATRSPVAGAKPDLTVRSLKELADLIAIS
jgi:2-haloacid dehalogenase